MEFDSYQHYFYDHDAQEDFHRSTAPSEDIWKKFELVPTPPLSPLGPPGEKGCCSGAEERPGWLSRYCLAGEEPEYLIGTGQIFGNLSAFILKDCMWSGFSARERLEKAMTEKLSTGTQRATPHKPSFAQDFGFSSSVSECVDPAAVFLCPLAESKIPASSGSEGQSDSGKGWSRLAAELPPALLEPGVGNTRVHTCVCGDPPSRPAPLLRLQASPGPGPANKAGSAVPLALWLSAREASVPLGRGRGGPSGCCVGLWWPLSLVPTPWKPRGKVEGQVCSSPWKVRGFERCTALCRRLEIRLLPFLLPTAHPGRASLGTKGKRCPGGGRFGSSGVSPEAVAR